MQLKNKLLKSTFLVGGLTIISRILGFTRDVLIAHTFGAGAGMDAFLIAFKIPNFMRRLFAEGAFSQAFTPVLSEYKSQQTPAAVQQLVNAVAGSLGSLLLLVTLIGVLAAPLLVLLFAPGFTQDLTKYELTVELLKITFPYLFFIALTAFAGSVLNTFGKFAVPAFTPVLLNITLITAAVYFSPHFEQPIVALAWGVFFAGIIQLLFQLPFLSRLNLLPRPQLQRNHPGVKKIHRLMMPALLGVSVSQINLLVDTLMASFLVTGSISWLYYSDRLMEFPVGVFGLALATVMLPNLSRTVAQGKMETFRITLDWALRWVFLIALPAMVGLMTLAVPILITLFHSGEFNQQDVIRTTQSLIAYSLGLLGFVLIKVLASAYYARQDTKTPVKVAIIAMLVNIGLNLLLIGPLVHAGLALATSLAALLNASLLYRGLISQGVYLPQAGWRRFLIQTIMASSGMAALLWTVSGSMTTWLQMSTWTQIYSLMFLMILGVISYFGFLLMMGFRWQQVALKSYQEFQ